VSWFTKAGRVTVVPACVGFAVTDDRGRRDAVGRRTQIDGTSHVIIAKSIDDATARVQLASARLCTTSSVVDRTDSPTKIPT